MKDKPEGYTTTLQHTNGHQVFFMFVESVGITKRSVKNSAIIDRHALARLSHEIYHLVENVMGAVGISHCKESEEAFAYYYSYILEQILKKV